VLTIGANLNGLIIFPAISIGFLPSFMLLFQRFHTSGAGSGRNKAAFWWQVTHFNGLTVALAPAQRAARMHPGISPGESRADLNYGC
jgi:hypothetical protein